MNKENIFIWHNVDEAINKLHNEIQKRDNIINKAIEYIENHSYGLEEENYDKINDILDILKGSDKE